MDKQYCKDAKEYLLQVRKIDSLLEFEIDRLKRLKELETGVESAVFDSTWLNARRGDTTSNFVRLTEEREQCEAYYNHLLGIQLDLIKQIKQQLSLMPHTLWAKVLSKKYLYGETHDEIAYDTGYAVNYISECSAWGMKEFDKMFSPFEKVI